MDSFKSALKHLFIWLPVETLSKIAEVLGILYGLMEYPFSKGKYKASKIYDKIEK